MTAVGKWRKERRVLGVDLISEALQLEVVDDALLQQAGEIGGRRYPKAGPHLFGDRAAADELTALKHEHSLPCPGQVRGRYQTVVARAHNDRVVLSRRHCCIVRRT